MKLTDSMRGGSFLEQLSDYEIFKKALVSFLLNFKNIFMCKHHIKLPFTSLHFEDPGLDERIILRWILGKWDVEVWTRMIWLRIGTGGGHL